MFIKVLTLAIALATLSTSSATAIKHKGVMRAELISLGAIGEKSYYAGDTELSYEDGRALCASQGHVLATVDSAEEEAFLFDHLDFDDSANGFSHYITAGRINVAWEGSSSVINSIGPVEYSSGIELLTIRAAYYETRWETREELDTWPPVCQSS